MIPNNSDVHKTSSYTIKRYYRLYNFVFVHRHDSRKCFRRNDKKHGPQPGDCGGQGRSSDEVSHRQH